MVVLPDASRRRARNPIRTMPSPSPDRTPHGVRVLGLLAALVAAPARASFLSGDALDTAANVISWVALILVPLILIVVFWIVHVMPEKIAERNHHPQAKAINTLCLLSLVFGGMLWPIAWLWAYTKPVAYRVAYGTDKGETYFDEQGEKARRGERRGEQGGSERRGAPQAGSTDDSAHEGNPRAAPANPSRARTALPRVRKDAGGGTRRRRDDQKRSSPVTHQTFVFRFSSWPSSSSSSAPK